MANIGYSLGEGGSELKLWGLGATWRQLPRIRYSIVVVSIVWNIPQKHKTISAEVLSNDSEALFDVRQHDLPNSQIIYLPLVNSFSLLKNIKIKNENIP